MAGPTNAISDPSVPPPVPSAAREEAPQEHLGRRGSPRALITGLVAAIAISAIAGLVAFALSESRDSTYEASAKVAFIEDTLFDYADAERDRLVGYVEAAEGAEILARETIVDVRYVRPSLQTFLDVEVTSSNPDEAREAANELAALIVERDSEFRTAPLDARISGLRALVDELDSEISILDAEVADAAASEAFAEANRFETDAETLERLTIDLREAQDTLSLSGRRRNQFSDARDRALIEIAELEVERDAGVEVTRVVRPATLPLRTEEVSSATLALLVGLAAFATALTLWMIVAPSNRRGIGRDA